MAKTNIGGKYLLRLGVHAGCNQRCLYCNPPGVWGKDIMSDEDLVETLVAAHSLGIRKVHLTGGEPLMRSTLPEILGEAAARGAKMEYYLTTNGAFLGKYAKGLRKNGVVRVNVSLDSLDPKTQAQLAQAKTLSGVLAGLSAAKGLFDSVKVNMVVMRNYNLGEIGDFIDYCQDNGFILRLMELLPFSTSEQPADFFFENHVSKRELEGILRKFGKLRPAKVGGNNWACDYWLVGNRKLPIGIVYHHTRGYFCVKQRCESIRVGPGGELAACYTQGAPSENIKGLSLAGKKKTLAHAIAIKQKLEKGELKYPPYHIPEYLVFRANVRSGQWKGWT